MYKYTTCGMVNGMRTKQEMIDEATRQPEIDEGREIEDEEIRAELEVV